MTGYEVYQTYLAVKFHFDRTNYNALKFNFKVNAKSAAFEARRDKFYFDKLARKYTTKEELINLFVSNNIYSNSKMWIGNIKEEYYTQYNKIHQALSYYFKTDMEKCHEFCQQNKISFDSLLKNTINKSSIYPDIFNLYFDEKVLLETICILHKLTGFLTHLNKKIDDNILWPELYHKLYKYSLFVECDKKKMKNIIINLFTNNE